MLTVAVALLPAVTFPAQAVTWTGPSQITNTTNLHYSPQTVQDSLGNVYMFWDQNPAIYYMVTTTSQIATNTWPAPSQYTHTVNNFDIEPSPVALKNGTLMLFYSSRRGNNYDIYYSRLNSGTWSAETRLTTSPATDENPTTVQDANGNLWVAWTRSETGDINIRFVDTNLNGAWDPGEAIVYDSNGNGLYDSGEPSIYGAAPANGTSLKIDPRLGFMDGNGNNLWDTGEFVVYDTNLDSIYNPKFMYVDSNTNNVWDPGETIVYKANSTVLTFLGTGKCSGSSAPTTDCVITGPTPSASTVLRFDTRLKFVDLNGDAVWEPGELLVSDTNNNGVYDNGEQAISPLTSDPKIRFTGPGSTWVSGNTVVYDSNGNGKYDGKIKFVDANGNGHWDPGETVVYDVNMDGFYGFADFAIFETTPQGDIGWSLKNDPALRFADANGNGVWDQGEAVVYDVNMNGLYEGPLKFADSNSNGVWDSGESVVLDPNNNGLYDSGETVVAGSTPTLGQAVKTDLKIKFSDLNGDMLWEMGEPVIYDSNNNALYDTSEPVIAGATPAASSGVTTGMGETVVAYGSPSLLSTLKTDSKSKFLDLNSNNLWDPGEPLTYDSNNNGVYDLGEPVIAGFTPSLSSDPRVKFVDANSNLVWDIGETVVYDLNSNGVYDSGETVIAGTAPSVGQALKTDGKIKYLDSNLDAIWDSGETVIYDNNSNGVYDLGEPVIAGTAPVLKSDPAVKYSDANGNNVWDSAEPVVYDANSNNLYNFGEYVIRGSVPQAGSALTISIGEPLIAGTVPSPGTTLKSDSSLKFVDLNGNLLWDVGEAVVQDVNSSGLYDTGDNVVAGTPVPANGTPLRSDETGLAGIIAAVGTTFAAADTRMKFVKSGTNTTWVPGETVVYDDTSGPGVGVYNFGKLHNDTVVSGGAPLNNTSIFSDSKLRYSDSNGNSHWDIGEQVFYDSNNNNAYDSGESIVASSFAPSTSAVLKTDSKLKYFDANINSHWDPGESVVYDSNSNGSFDSGDIALAGPVPGVGSPLVADSKIRFIDSFGNLVWNPGEIVVYDSNGNSAYDLNEPILRSNTLSPGTPLRSVTHIFYKSLTLGSWSAEQRLTVQPYNDKSPSIAQTEDGKIWIVWSGERPGGPAKILSRTTLDGVTWTSDVALTTPGTYGDNDPSIAQDRNGTIWIAWGRNVPCSCGQAAFEEDLFTISSINNGASWSAASALTSTTGQDEIEPNMSQLNDKRLYIFFPTVVCSGSTCTVDLYFYYTQVLMHAARMNSFAVNATSFRAGQIIKLTANVTNTGDYNDTLRFYAKYNGTLIPLSSSIVTSLQTKLITINWATAGVPPGHYILTGNVTVTGEGVANFVDNFALPITVLVRPAGDANGDCTVNIVDLVLVAGAFGKSAGQPGYNAISDLNNDGVINIQDLSTVGTSFGQHC